MGKNYHLLSWVLGTKQVFCKSKVCNETRNSRNNKLSGFCMKHALIQLLSNSQSTCFCLRNKKSCAVFLSSYRLKHECKFGRMRNAVGAWAAGACFHLWGWMNCPYSFMTEIQMIDILPLQGTIHCIPYCSYNFNKYVQTQTLTKLPVSKLFAKKTKPP